LSRTCIAPRADSGTLAPPASSAPRQMARAIGAGLMMALLSLSSGCATPERTAPTVAPSLPGPIQVFGPACPGVRSCLMGRVVAAETMAPLARAMIFLERTAAPTATTEADLSATVHYVRFTDKDGVFTVTDVPAGLYRLAVYNEARRKELSGISLGEPGTTMVPVRLPKT